MKRTIRILSGIFALATCLVFTNCEGPAGQDQNETCVQCHSSSSSLKVKQGQFKHSAHAVGTRFDSGGECAACHSSQGFLAFEKYNGSITAVAEADLGELGPIDCGTCHTVHTNYDSTDWALTYTGAVDATLLGAVSPDYPQTALMDMGASNMCVNCHQSRDRGNVPAADATGELNISSSHWGPHYGVQGNVLNATGGVEVSGSETYPSAPNGHANLDNACVTCHMHDGSHTLAVNFDACESCHNSAGDAEDMVDALEKEVHDLLFSLGAELFAQGVMSENMEAGKVSGYSPKRGDVTADQGKAIWNYMVVYQDHSYGVHNPSYIKALLKNSIAAVQ